LEPLRVEPVCSTHNHTRGKAAPFDTVDTYRITGEPEMDAVLSVFDAEELAAISEAASALHMTPGAFVAEAALHVAIGGAMLALSREEVARLFRILDLIAIDFDDFVHGCHKVFRAHDASTGEVA
jgi:hypothetical protein